MVDVGLLLMSLAQPGQFVRCAVVALPKMRSLHRLRSTVDAILVLYLPEYSGSLLHDWFLLLSGYPLLGLLTLFLPWRLLLVVRLRLRLTVLLLVFSLVVFLLLLCLRVLLFVGRCPLWICLLRGKVCVLILLVRLYQLTMMREGGKFV